MNKITEQIWIGDENDAANPVDADAIITICDIETKRLPAGWPGIRIVIYQPDEDVIPWYRLTFFVRSLELLVGCERKKILIHCREGRSRSPIFLAAYLMTTGYPAGPKDFVYYYNWDQAFGLIKAARPEVKEPNEIMKQSVLSWKEGFWEDFGIRNG